MIVWLNGNFINETRAKISVFDRGFLYGEGLFETMRGYNGAPFAYFDHMARLDRGLKVLSLQIAYSTSDLLLVMRKLLSINNLTHQDSYIRITVTRGSTGNVRDFKATEPTCLIFCRQLNVHEINEKRKVGINVISVPLHRDFLAEFKHLSYLSSLFALLRISTEKESDEAIFIGQDSSVLEGATSNIFFYDDTRVITPPARSILPGIMRNCMIDALKKEGVKIQERKVNLKDIKHFKGAFITNSIIELLPVRSMDGVLFSLEKSTFFYTALSKTISSVKI
ncbi:MAG: aminotransferase class IV [Dissulfurispiraceae bacterium]